AGEEAHEMAWTARAERLAPAHGGEDGVARVLLRPDGGETARAVLDLELQAVQPELTSRRDVVVHAVVPAVVVLPHVTRSGIVRVGGRDDAQPERVHPDTLLLDESFLQGVSCET